MSQHKDQPDPALRTGRRGFLASAGALCGALGAMAALPAWAATSNRPRSLRFVHTHTGETLTAPYFDGSLYNSACLQKVNVLLRDFRTGESHRIDPPLLDILYDLQTLADHDAPFEVISGYRSPQTNAMLHQKSSGVAEHSQHIVGKAIDVRLSGYSTRRLSAYARSLSRGGVGFYAGSDFVHVDTGRVRYW
ncbi:MAG: YcbK family protein [Steroidobacteraceae bacterium]